MGKNVTLVWPAYVQADETTVYNLYADKAEPGVFDLVTQKVAALNPNGANYTPLLSTLEAAVTDDENDTTFKLLTGTENDFDAGAYATVGRELVKLGMPNGTPNWYEVTLRGLGGTSRAAHPLGATVYHCHYLHADNNVDFGARHVLRYRLQAVHNGAEQRPVEYVAYSPPLPEENSLCTVYGTVQELGGINRAGLECIVTLAAGGLDYMVGTSEYLFPGPVRTYTDEDGFFAVKMPRDIARSGSGVFELVIQESANSSNVIRWTINTVPDSDIAHFRNTA